MTPLTGAVVGGASGATAGLIHRIREYKKEHKTWRKGQPRSQHPKYPKWVWDKLKKPYLLSGPTLRSIVTGASLAGTGGAVGGFIGQQLLRKKKKKA